MGEHFRILVTEQQQQSAGTDAVRCVSCGHASDGGHDPWRGWCLAHRTLVSNTFPKLCPEYRRS